MQVQAKDFAEETGVQITGALENWLYFASREEMLLMVLDVFWAQVLWARAGQAPSHSDKKNNPFLETCAKSSSAD